MSSARKGEIRMRPVVAKPAKTEMLGRAPSKSVQEGTVRRRICELLSFLRLHNPDCEHCNASQTRGDEIRQRLEELCWRTQPSSLQLATTPRRTQKTKRRQR